ncbi:MAG: Crp/Fnr family transcriptional regulator [Hymenobacteraceae bacterium]|nr:Crp/Fnr family transcriptional regulator [Hymenobacteraceae bacterium]MDX5395142.1 Crp/Fnr family transcriptional regulator [Hymenobacteraceae bacterium]MDX5444333.1 Crp/Fnr family transcriptional regulator [Hymenobacteraceae bacterium]MDX5511183.1 Crp/Fnr family transcriptional regulator [Hymenobacteraceae bacterium]
MKFTPPDCEQCKSRNESLFNCCQTAELASMSQSKSCHIYKKGQVVFNEGSKPHGLYCINSGKIKITKQGSDGKEQIIRLAKPGDVIGYRALMAETAYSASAVSLEDAVVCFIPKPEFEKLIDSNIHFSNGLMKLLSKTLGEAEEKMVNMAYKPVRERLAEALLLLQKTYQSKTEDMFTISISREDLASIVGTAKETTIRLLSDFKEEGIITTKGSSITILDKEKLYKISHLYD